MILKTEFAAKQSLLILWMICFLHWWFSSLRYVLLMKDPGLEYGTWSWAVPEDLDRSSPLEERPDITGRCLRLLSCVYHPRLKDAIGELLFAIADSDASTLCSLVGYGNVAGFLFHKGFFSAPSRSSNISTSTSSGESINPITGTTVKPTEGLDMTDEEKECEAEKLFVLFDRLEKTGAIPPEQNPMRKAIQQRRV
jgi:hypothetical protein